MCFLYWLGGNWANLLISVGTVGGAIGACIFAYKQTKLNEKSNNLALIDKYQTHYLKSRSEIENLYHSNVLSYDNSKNILFPNFESGIKNYKEISPYVNNFSNLITEARIFCFSDAIIQDMYTKRDVLYDFMNHLFMLEESPKIDFEKNYHCTYSDCRDRYLDLFISIKKFDWNYVEKLYKIEIEKLQ